MARMMLRNLSGGANQQGVRDHNERLILSLFQREGPMPGSDLARVSGLSPQTISVILRGLEQDGFISRGTPTRGKVGKPSIPMALAAEGVLSVGLKIGRRSADLVLVDFHGQLRQQMHKTYRYPTPEIIFGFLRDGLATICADLTESQIARIAGIGIGKPFEMWNWHETIGAPAEALAVWKGIDFAAEVARFSDLPVFEQNDATAACRAEHVYGKGRGYRDFAYFFIGSFIGGGIVLNNSVFEGNSGNAGALGSLPSKRSDGGEGQLIDRASLYLLETVLMEHDLDPMRLWGQPQDWSGFDDHLDAWIENAATGLARAAVTVCAVIDFEAVLIDGGFPPSVRARLVQRTREEVAGLDHRGMTLPRIEEGGIGGNARALGAACGPVFSRYLLNTHARLSNG